MISREDHESAIEGFMMEMSAICSAQRSTTLKSLPGFLDEVKEHVELSRDATPEETLAMSFGLVDEFVKASWDSAMREAYALYVDMNGGRSHRHPSAAQNSGSDAPSA